MMKAHNVGTTGSSRLMALVAVVAMLATLMTASGALPAYAAATADFEFVFSNGEVFSGSTGGGDASIPHEFFDEYYGGHENVPFDHSTLSLHVSCSESSPGGWAAAGNSFPIQGTHAEWHIASYTIQRTLGGGQVRNCGETFDPGSVTVIKTTNPVTTELFSFDLEGSIPPDPGTNGTAWDSFEDGQAVPGDDGEYTWTGLETGEYTLSEDTAANPPEYEFESLNCISTLPGFSYSADGASASFELHGGEEVTCTFDNASGSQPAEVTVTPSFACDIQWSEGEFVMHGSVDFEVDPSAGVTSIEITPKEGGVESIEGATWTGDPLSLLPWAYTYTVNYANGYGGPEGGEFDFDRAWFAEQCSCPEGTIDLSDTGVLRATIPTQDSRPGEPASPVTIAEGYYEIVLASYDDHSHKPDQHEQTEEQWQLANAEDALGSWASPSTGDLPSDLNFMSYDVTAGEAVLIPAFANAILWTNNTGSTSNINSVQPACAKLIPEERTVEVTASAGACEVDGQGNPVGVATVTIDPDTKATVKIYDDPAKEAGDLVATVTESGNVPDLPVGTYYWDAEPAAGYTTETGSGQFTIEPCEVTVVVGGECVLDGEEGHGVISVEISTSGAATVHIYDGGTLLDTLTGSGMVSVPEGKTYTWEAEASAGFALVQGSEGGEVQIDQCTPEPAVIIVEKFVTLGDQTEEFEFVTTGFTLDDHTLAHGQSSSSGDLDPGTYAVSEILPDESWEQVSAACDNGDDPGEVTVDHGDVVTCTFTNIQDEVAASVLVTVGGSCTTNEDGTGSGAIDVTLSVPGGANVVIRSGANTVATFADDGTVSVPIGQNYTWEATANDGFEFPAGFVSSGTVTIEDCASTLPLTGIDSDRLFGISILLLGAGSMLVFTGRRREDG